MSSPFLQVRVDLVIALGWRSEFLHRCASRYDLNLTRHDESERLNFTIRLHAVVTESQRKGDAQRQDFRSHFPYRLLHVWLADWNVVCSFPLRYCKLFLCSYVRPQTIFFGGLASSSSLPRAQKPMNIACSHLCMVQVSGKWF